MKCCISDYFCTDETTRPCQNRRLDENIAPTLYFVFFGHAGVVYWFPVCHGSCGVLDGVEGEQMSSHMEEPRSNTARHGGGDEGCINFSI